MKQDKKQHILMGVVVAIVVGFITYLVSGEVAAERNVAAGVYSALSGGFVAACVKEYCDTEYSIKVTEWDWADIGFTMIGTLFIVSLILGIHFGRG